MYYLERFCCIVMSVADARVFIMWRSFVAFISITFSWSNPAPWYFGLFTLLVLDTFFINWYGGVRLDS